MPNNKLIAALRILARKRQDRYMDMFRSILEKKPSQSESINERVKTARKALEREDRVLWYLRRYRDGLLGRTEPVSPNLLTNLIHYVQNAKVNDYDAVLNFQWAKDLDQDTLISTLQDLEKKAQEEKKTNRLIDPDEYDEDDYEEFLNIDNQWVWHLLDYSSCEIEGEAMGHCGNEGSQDDDDRILSLREIVKKGKKTYWKPHATFILNNGVLGEMKGPYNEKPREEVHPYIVKLLEDPRIKLIGGGGYEAHKNFALDDLDNATKERLLARRPDLQDLEAYYRLHGTDEAFSRIVEHNSIMQHEGSLYVVLREFDHIGDSSARIFGSDVERLIELEEKGVPFIEHDGSWTSDVLEEVVEQYLKDYPDEKHDYDQDEYDSVEEYLLEEHENELNAAMNDAATSDAEARLWSSLLKHITDYQGDYEARFIFPKEEGLWHEFVLGIPLRNFLKAKGDNEDIENYYYEDSDLQFSMPSLDGVDDWGAALKYAAERFAEMI